jgi:hypothetical protein
MRIGKQSKLHPRRHQPNLPEQPSPILWQVRPVGIGTKVRLRHSPACHANAWESSAMNLRWVWDASGT